MRFFTAMIALVFCISCGSGSKWFVRGAENEMSAAKKILVLSFLHEPAVYRDYFEKYKSAFDQFILSKKTEIDEVIKNRISDPRVRKGRQFVFSSSGNQEGLIVKTHREYLLLGYEFSLNKEKLQSTINAAGVDAVMVFYGNYGSFVKHDSVENRRIMYQTEAYRINVAILGKSGRLLYSNRNERDSHAAYFRSPDHNTSKTSFKENFDYPAIMQKIRQTVEYLTVF